MWSLMVCECAQEAHEFFFYNTYVLIEGFLITTQHLNDLVIW